MVIQDVTERRNAQLEINRMARFDSVTGLPNRSVINHVLELVGRLGGNACRGTLLFIDIDNFKRVNDTIGHEAGDELLRQVSKRIITDGLGLTNDDLDRGTTAFGELSQRCPEKIVFSRFAGDEFVALLPGEVDRNQVESRANGILKALNEPFLIDGNELRVSASIGIARVPVDTERPDELLRYADIAMYAAKENGRNQLRFFDASLKDLAIERAQIETDLRRAIENGEDTLSLHYQPKLDARTLELRGVEALARWRHPEKGMIPPDKFIGIAEQMGLIPALGARILDMAARQARDWKEQGKSIPIAVNVSAVQFDRPTLVADILAAADHYQIDPSLLEIEITESMAMSGFAESKRKMDQLREAGITIAIDDFGTGYSNLFQLSRLPFGVLKIDKSLIKGIGDNGKSEAIVTAIIHMAHAMGHRVVAEGVETLPQHAFLRKTGCDEVQGYLHARDRKSVV
jgi:two-component system CheB/CheR fusion protein